MPKRKKPTTPKKKKPTTPKKKKPTTAKEKHYEVGYCKAPKHSQFQKGHLLGNRKGRPKGRKNLKTDLLEELAERILVTEGGRQRSISKQRAMIKSLFAKAVKTGDVQAGKTIIGMIERLLEPETSESEERPLSGDDQEILEVHGERLLQRYRKQPAADQDGPQEINKEEDDNDDWLN